MTSLKIFVFNSFQENTFILYDNTRECIIVDPGMSTSDEENVLHQFISEKQLKPVAILNTHCHVDHVLGIAHSKEKYQIPFYCHKNEIPLLENAKDHGAFFGIQVETPPLPDKFLEEQGYFSFGDTKLKLLPVPGHSPGSIALYNEESKFVITGDALFRGSIGRTDLPGGDYQTLINSIQSQLLTLPKEVDVYPGHGPMTAIGVEYDTNPFLN